MTSGRWFLDWDWYDGGIPGNVEVGEDVYLDSSHCFAAFHSERRPGLVLGEASGVYDRTALVLGPKARVTVGPYTCLNASYLIASRRITIGSHCLLAWGAVITDTWPTEAVGVEERRAALEAAAGSRHRIPPPVVEPRPVTLEDNVWVGFDAVILPGVTLGRGCLIGCKTIVEEDVPPYAVVVGDPARVVRRLEPDDTPEARAAAFDEYLVG